MARRRTTLGSKLALFVLAVAVLVYAVTRNAELAGTVLAAAVVVWLVFRVLLGGRRR